MVPVPVPDIVPGPAGVAQAPVTAVFTSPDLTNASIAFEVCRQGR